MWEAHGTRESKGEFDIENTVKRQLRSCDPILKRHRIQALRVTCLHLASSYLWIGTTAGVTLSLGKCLKEFIILLKFVKGLCTKAGFRTV